MARYNVRIKEQAIVDAIESSVENGMYQSQSEFIRYAILLAVKDKSEELRLLHKAKKTEILSRVK